MADIVNVRTAQTGWGRHSHEIAYITVSGRGSVHVDGIGPRKAQALLSRKKEIEYRFRNQIPQSLPSAQESAIRSNYQVQRQSLDLQETNARQNAMRRKDAVRTKYRQEQNAITEQLQNVQDQFAKQRGDLDQKISEAKRHMSEKSWTLAKSQRELDAYKQVNFAAYLKRILSLRNMP
jgi:hypothetical protein